MDGAGQIVWGHVVLAVCFALYLAWWCIFFRPGGIRPEGALRTVGIISIVCAVICGIAGVALCIVGVTQLPRRIITLPTWEIVLVGMIAYVALFVITTIPLDRPPTTELALITGWATLEIVCVNALYAAGAFKPAITLVMLIVIIALTVLSMVCYVKFYGLEGWASLIDGAVPLVCGIVYAIAIVVAVLVLAA